MAPFLPDWMFAAFAIGGWELANLVVTKLYLHWFRYVGIAIVAACVVVLVSRYIVRWIKRRRNPEQTDPDAWRQY